MQHKDSPNEPRLRLPPILSNTPSLVETMIEGFEADTLEWRPSPQRWSVTMVIAHLAESEVNCFRLRLRRTAVEQKPILEAYDQWAQFREQPLLSASEALQTWRRNEKRHCDSWVASRPTWNFVSALTGNWGSCLRGTSKRIRVP